MSSAEEFAKWYDKFIDDENKPVREAAWDAWQASRRHAAGSLEGYLLKQGSAMSTAAIAGAWLRGQYD